jgi:hypothetical protein
MYSNQRVAASRNDLRELWHYYIRLNPGAAPPCTSDNDLIDEISESLDSSIGKDSFQFQDKVGFSPLSS